MSEKFNVKRWVPLIVIALIGAKAFRRGARHAKRHAWAHRRRVEAL